MNDSILQIDPTELKELVPEEYALWRPIIAEGLSFFLNHLSPARLAEIVEAQMALPADARSAPPRCGQAAQARRGRSAG
jgi:hypothetical protein